MTIQQLRSISAQITRGLAYFLCLLQWLWLSLIALPPLIESGSLDGFIPQESTAPPITTPSLSFDVSPATTALVGVVTLFMLVLTIFVMIKLPSTIAKTGDRVVKKTSDAIVPAITHHAKLPKKRQLVITARVGLVIQVLLVIIPLLGTLLLPELATLSKQIANVIACGLAGMSLSLFVLGYFLQKR